MSGALTTAALVGLFAAVALRPPLPRRSTMFNLQFGLGYLINEQPWLGLWWLLSGTLGTLARPVVDSALWWLVVAVAALDVAGLAALALRAGSARPVLRAALEEGFGPGAGPRATRPPWLRILFLPVIAWRPDVRRVRNRRYGPSRRGHRLDLYVSRGRRSDGTAPVLLYLHPGGFRIGTKMLGGHPLLYRLAARGWVCLSADYRLWRVGHADQVADACAALAWARENVESYGGDPSALLVAGGSAGAHLAATAALRGEQVRGVIGLYGYYGPTGGAAEGTSPADLVTPGAPPFLIVHGAIDTLVLATDVRRFVGRLQSVSEQPVAYAELPGTQHHFDFFHSRRIHAVTDAVARFAELTMPER